MMNWSKAKTGNKGERNFEAWMWTKGQSFFKRKTNAKYLVYINSISMYSCSEPTETGRGGVSAKSSFYCILFQDDIMTKKKIYVTCTCIDTELSTLPILTKINTWDVYLIGWKEFNFVQMKGHTLFHREIKLKIH